VIAVNAYKAVTFASRDKVKTTHTGEGSSKFVEVESNVILVIN
jgi:hypothetical protein